MNVKQFLAEEAKERVHKSLKGLAPDKKKGVSHKKRGSKAQSMSKAKAQHEKKSKKAGKVEKVMKEFSKKELHSGSKKGPLVTNPKQALAIGYSEKRRAKKKK
jgi:hypothetical protein